MSTLAGYAARLHNYLQSRQMGHALSWAESTSGPSHQAMWTVVCKSGHSQSIRIH
ncbi:hypothetical protein NEOLEDRAFT_1130570 [Neolentinus lepideus HHB14362 ss-1]|uniref:Uncharacterized protein n=1 Tax=Neolentinus lepideus HHB14362 ss-1 TaxID=1314782 RepID=A0A165U349_9AGAM|nr:hypothetical protein NEOLEDRAFT_1130570 [Neolentinus lepideus HHB14362 ss-1]